MCRQLLILFLLTLATPACHSGPLGNECASESECDFGLRCFQGGEFSAGICTVRCDEGCADGLCVPSEHGDLCATPCNAPGECPESQRCQMAPGMERPVCWPFDANLAPIVGERPLFPQAGGPPDPVISGFLITDDANEDGVLSAGEYADLNIFVRNAGADPIEGLWAAVSTANPALTIKNCHALGGSYCSDRDSTQCSCDSNSNSAYMDLGGGESIEDQQLITINVELEENTVGLIAFDVVLGDRAGNRWPRSLQVPISDSGARVVFESLEIVDDRNEDLLANPGETVEFMFYARNTGPQTALGVWGAIEAPEGFTIRQCEAGGGSYCSDRDAGQCSCETNSNSWSLDIPAGSVGINPILSMQVEIDRELIAGSHDFEFTWGDNLGNRWTETVPITVSDTGANLVVSSTQGEMGGAAVLTNGQRRVIEVFVRNDGTAMATDVWASIQVPEAELAIRNCYAYGGASYCSDRDAGQCSCDGNSNSVYIDLDAGETSSAMMIEVDIEATAAASGPRSFPVLIGDGFGNTWMSSAMVQVQ